MTNPARRVFLLCFLASGLCSAQNGAPPAGKHPDLGLTEVGRQHHAIQTKSQEAQAFFDQGITLIYGFNHEEAARAFEAAARLDPASPMPLWGIALAVGPNYNQDVDAEREKLAFDTVQKAKTLAAGAPAIEQDYVNALAVRYSAEAHPDYKALARNYAVRMRGLSQKYPEDLDAATLYAESLMNLNPWKLWSLEGAPAEDTAEIVRVLESVLSRDPAHAGANHYYIHAVEASRSPERALPSAARLETMVPKAGHLVHMPSHIYSRVGSFSEAARSNAKAIEADRSYAAEAERSGSLYDLMYHSHNEHFLAFAASMQGRYADARKAADEMSKRLLPHADMMPMLDSFVWTPIWVDLRFSKWKEILARPEPPANRKVPRLMWRYSRVLAYASQREMAKAEAEHAAFAKEAASLPPEAPIGQMNPNDAMLAVATAIASAKLEAAKGDTESEMKHWRAAVEAQDKLNYTEPPDWYYPVRESLGAALFSAGRVKEAEAVFREDLLRNPRNPRSLFGLKQCLAAQHAENDAAWVERQFRDAWKDADTQLKIGDF
jgi:tetratricopeptide (TPR) repeat protein